MVISLIWLWLTLLVANFYPLIDGGLRQIWIVVRGKKAVKASTEIDDVDSPADTTTPPSEAVMVEPKY